MGKIKLLGLPNEKFEKLKNKLERLIELIDHDIQLVEIKNVNLIVAAKIESVPAAIYEGEKEYHWDEFTPIEDMLAQLKEDQKAQNHACTCGSGCRMKREDPSYSCHD